MPSTERHQQFTVHKTCLATALSCSSAFLSSKMSPFSTEQSKMYLWTFQHRLFLTYDFAMLILTADFYRYTYTYQNFKFCHIKIINKKKRHKKSYVCRLNATSYVLCPFKHIYFLNHYSNHTFATSCNSTCSSKGEKLRTQGYYKSIALYYSSSSYR